MVKAYLKRCDTERQHLPVDVEQWHNPVDVSLGGRRHILGYLYDICKYYGICNSLLSVTALPKNK